jgi:hypothetical protein
VNAYEIPSQELILHFGGDIRCKCCGRLTTLTDGYCSRCGGQLSLVRRECVLCQLRRQG